MCSVDVVANYVGCSVVAVCYGRFACVTGVGVADIHSDVACVDMFMFIVGCMLMLLLFMCYYH